MPEAGCARAGRGSSHHPDGRGGPVWAAGPRAAQSARAACGAHGATNAASRQGGDSKRSARLGGRLGAGGVPVASRASPWPPRAGAHCRLCFDPIAMAERHAVGELLRALFCHSVAARPGPTDSERRGKSRGDGAHSFHLMAPFLSVAVVRKRRAKFPDPSATAAPPTASLVSTNKKLFL